ncbi:MAG: hypothetical protein KDE04_21520 [Anaerolineales bacterium]|nr:hypothetical protein [Anaerolineales bacterium]MCB8961205.1 hypothetical protein [Ardenticatenales bacterium]
MPTPKDMQAGDRVGLVKAARIFSNVISPPIMFAALGLAIALSERPFWPGFGWAWVYGLLISGAPILVVLFLLYTNRIAELHMSNTRERHIPYISAVFFAVVAYLILRFAGGPAGLICLAIFNIIELSALGIINAYWLISLHSAGMTATVVIVALVFGWLPALCLLPLLLLVVYARLFLKRHNMAQILAGIALGAGAVLILVPFGCFT